MGVDEEEEQIPLHGDNEKGIVTRSSLKMLAFPHNVPELHSDLFILLFLLKLVNYRSMGDFPFRVVKFSGVFPFTCDVVTFTCGLFLEPVFGVPHFCQIDQLKIHAA
jgi:hypothetical protein